MKNKKGFTLVELLAVIVILGVLLLIAVPAVTGIQKTAKQKAAKDGALMFLKAIETCGSMEDDITSCTTTTTGKIKDYYEGKVDSSCDGTADCAVVTEFSTDGKITMQYRLGGYGFMNSSEATISDLRTIINGLATSNIVSSTSINTES